MGPITITGIGTTKSVAAVAIANQMIDSSIARATFRIGDQVLQLDGAGDYVSVPIGNHTFTNFTIELWVKVPAYDGNVHYVSLFQNAYLVLGNYDIGQVSTWAGGLTPVDAGPASVGGLTTNAWHHFAMSYDGTNQYILIDGAVILTALTTGALIHDAVTQNQGLVIGTRYDTTTQWVSGRLDDVRIWNVYRTPAQIIANMNGPLTGSEGGLVGYWNFDDGTAADLTANNANGTLQGDAVIVID